MVIENNDMGFNSAQERMGAAISGVFLFFFGFPFTLVPFIVLPNVYGEGMMLNVFMFCFTLPFLCAGLLVQTLGCASVMMALFPESEFARNQLRKRREVSTSGEPDGDLHSFPSYAEEFGVDRPVNIEKISNFWDDVDGK